MDRQLRFSLFIGVMVILLACVCVVSGSAGDAMPEGLFSWYDETIGATCYVWPDGSGDCYCPCEVGEDCETKTITPTVGPDPTDVPPTPTDEPVPSETPEPTEQAACNRGLGNGSEDCDPGNSGGKPGAAGEDNE